MTKHEENAVLKAQLTFMHRYDAKETKGAQLWQLGH